MKTVIRIQLSMIQNLYHTTTITWKQLILVFFDKFNKKNNKFVYDIDTIYGFKILNGEY